MTFGAATFELDSALYVISCDKSADSLSWWLRWLAQDRLANDRLVQDMLANERIAQDRLV